MAQRLIGVDVGGTKVSVAVLEDGALSDPQITPTDLSSSDALVEQLVTTIQAQGPATAVGIGVPSVIDFATGTARSSVNIPLQGVPLRHALTERLGIPTFVDNDATVAALAEAHDDGMRPIADIVVMFTVGTGVGGGIVIGGRTFRGATGDVDALEAMRILGESLGVGIANAINTFDPEEVVVGGGVVRAGELLLEPARRVAWDYVLPGVGERTTIRAARHGEEAGMRGAALLAALELDDEEARRG
jgi:glucokinase